MQMLQTKATAGLEYKFTKFAASDLDEKTGIFRGYASTFGNEDQGGDIVVKGAFSSCLAAISNAVMFDRWSLAIIMNRSL